MSGPNRIDFIPSQRGKFMELCYWYSVNISDLNGTIYLFPARSQEIVRSVFGSICDHPQIQKLSWIELKTWTGCVIPSGRDPNEFARGSPGFPPVDDMFPVICVSRCS